MADNAPGRQSVFVSHVPLPLAAIQAKLDTALESGCGLDIMVFAPIYLGIVGNRPSVS
jgi:hypothetical protein